MLDFNHNNGFYKNPLIAVWGGRINDMVPLSYSSPYTLETRAHWVPNPAGEPKYYLQLNERFTHIADEKIGKLSIVGVGMRSHSGVAARMFEALANAGVNIDMISTSEIKISVVIDLAKGEAAIKAVHAAFLG